MDIMYVVNEYDRTGLEDFITRNLGVYDNIDRARSIILAYLFQVADDGEKIEGVKDNDPEPETIEVYRTSDRVIKIQGFPLNSPIV